MNDLHEYLEHLVRLRYRGDVVAGFCKLEQADPLTLVLKKGLTTHPQFSYWAKKGSAVKRYRPRDVELELVNILNEVVATITMKRAWAVNWEAEEQPETLLQTWDVDLLELSCEKISLKG